MQQYKTNPRTLSRELIILKNMGISNDEIQYLKWKELKDKINKKWERKHY